MPLLFTPVERFTPLGAGPVGKITPAQFNSRGRQGCLEQQACPGSLRCLQDGQAEIPLSLALSMGIVEGDAASYTPPQFRGVLRLTMESGEKVGPIQRNHGGYCR